MFRYELTVLGDSFSAGFGDPTPEGGLRGWVSRFSSLTNLNPDSVHNLAEYGATTRRAVKHQLPTALDGKAPLIVAFVGSNDLLADHKPYDAGRLRDNLHTLFDELSGTGTTVVTANYPDIPGNLDISDLTRRSLRKRFDEANQIMAEITWAAGVPCIDLAGYPVWNDTAYWDPDGLHPGPRLHQHFAEELMSLTKDFQLPTGLPAGA
jgi:lysophospholipase L1-like esterase